MACVILADERLGYFCFACNTTDVVFGPLCYVPKELDLRETANDFEKYLEEDPRSYEVSELCERWNKWSLENLS